MLSRTCSVGCRRAARTAARPGVPVSTGRRRRPAVPMEFVIRTRESWLFSDAWRRWPGDALLAPIRRKAITIANFLVSSPFEPPPPEEEDSTAPPPIPTSRSRPPDLGRRLPGRPTHTESGHTARRYRRRDNLARHSRLSTAGDRIRRRRHRLKTTPANSRATDRKTHCRWPTSIRRAMRSRRPPPAVRQRQRQSPERWPRRHVAAQGSRPRRSTGASARALAGRAVRRSASRSSVDARPPIRPFSIVRGVGPCHSWLHGRCPQSRWYGARC